MVTAGHADPTPHDGQDGAAFEAPLGAQASALPWRRADGPLSTVKIHVTLHAGLARYAPAGTSGRSTSLEVAPGTTVAGVIRALGMPEDLPCIPVLNDQRADAGTELAEGARLGLFPPLAGGAGSHRG